MKPSYILGHKDTCKLSVASDELIIPPPDWCSHNGHTNSDDSSPKPSLSINSYFGVFFLSMKTYQFNKLW